ncbi:MAG: hypothetical protein KC418_13930 [Anaerolineales bacterium]|nr:hypothetical protein [Anaerolineales bacterium]MCB8952138.1 hypothetical protein [Ardenticatenales bacterium]
MAHTTPKVMNNRLYLPDCTEPVCPVESPAWFDWLHEARCFRYYSQQRHNVIRGYGPVFAPISLRKEKRRRGCLWYAYRRSYRVLYKRYVGKTEALTRDRLEEIARTLNEVD